MIAYLIVAHSNLSNVSSLLSTIYDPDNIYLIHIDGDAKEDFVQSVAGFLCYTNIYVKHGESVAWNMTSILDATLWGIHALCGLSKNWRYFILLSGDDLAVKSPAEVKRQMAQLPPDACYIASPPRERREPSHEWFDEVSARAERENFKKFYTNPSDDSRQSIDGDGRLVNRWREPRMILSRKLKFSAAPRSSFTWQGFESRVLQNFVEVPELGAAVNRPLPWFLGRVRAQVLAQTGWARGPAWVMLARSFCEYILRDSVSMLVYAAFRSTSGLDEGFFQLLIANAPARFKDVWNDRSLTFCPWGDFLVVKQSHIDKIESTSHFFCRKIRRGDSDPVVRYATTKIGATGCPAVFGLLRKRAQRRQELEISDVVKIIGDWKFVRSTGEGLGRLTFTETGGIVNNNQPEIETTWTTKGGDLLLHRRDGAVSSELWCLSSDGTDVFVSGDYVLQRDLGINHTIYAPLRDRFLADCDDKLVSARLRISPPTAGRLMASRFRIALLAELYDDDFYWHGAYNQDLAEGPQEIVFDGERLMLTGQPGHEAGHFVCTEIHATGNDVLLLFDPPGPASRAGRLGSIVVATGALADEIEITIGTEELVRASWRLEGCDSNGEVWLLTDHKVVIDGAETGYWKIRAGQLFILGKAGFMRFDKFAWREGVLTAIGSLATGTLKPEPIRLTALLRA